MRVRVAFAILSPLLLSACASTHDGVARSPQEFQPGPLQVAPGLYGKNVRGTLDSPARLATVPVLVSPASASAPVSVEVPADTPPASAKPRSTAASPKIVVIASKKTVAKLPTERRFYFDRNAAKIKPEYVPILQVHARYLAEHKAARVRIEGHCDERGDPAYNRQLSLKRVAAIRAELIKGGAANKQVATKSYGTLKPMRKGHGETSWEKNRRVDVVYASE